MKKILTALALLFAASTYAATITVESFTFTIPDEKLERFADFLDNGVDKKLIGEEEDPAHKILEGDSAAVKQQKRVAKLNWRIQQLVREEMSRRELNYYEEKSLRTIRDQMDADTGIAE